MQRWRHGPNFIQKNRSAIRLLEQALFVADRSSECPAPMAEKLRFEQIFGQGAAIDRDERRELAAAVEMQRPRDQFLSGAALAQHQDRAVGVGHAPDEFEYLLHLRRAADDLVELVFLFELLAEISGFRDRGFVGESALHAKPQFVDLERLLQVIESPVFHRLDRGLDRAEAGDNDGDGRWIELARFANNLQAVRARFVEIKIGDNQVGGMKRERGAGGLAVGERENLVPILAQQLGDHLHHRQLIIDQ